MRLYVSRRYLCSSACYKPRVGEGRVEQDIYIAVIAPHLFFFFFFHRLRSTPLHSILLISILSTLANATPHMIISVYARLSVRSNGR